MMNINYYIKNLDLVNILYERKKQGRVSTTQNIPEILVEFVHLIEIKFDPEAKRKNINSKYQERQQMSEEWAESIFEKYLYKFNSNNKSTY